MDYIILRYCSTIVYVWSCDLSGIPLNKIHPQAVNYLLSVKQWPHNFMLQSDWLMLCYSASKILPVASQCQTNIASTGQKAVGPTVAANVGPTDMPMLGQHLHAICLLADEGDPPVGQ